MNRPDTDIDVALVQRVLARDRAALDDFVDRATPIVQRRVSRWLARQYQSATRNVRQELQDFTQEVFLALFEKDARALRGWQPDKGLSLDNFVGLVAERVAVSILRSGRRHPWREEPFAEEDLPQTGDRIDEPEVVTESHDALCRLLERLRTAVSPQGWRMFELLYIDDTPVTEVQQIAGMSADAVHQWRSRLRKLAIQLYRDVNHDSAPP